MKKILFAASEGLPYIKSGGLADVVGSLPKQLNDLGLDVRVVLPLYRKVALGQRERFEKVGTFHLKVAKFDVDVNVYLDPDNPVKTYFIEHQGYFERDGLYGYPDDGERFMFFQHVVINMLKTIGWSPDIFHCHDWHTGMIPILCTELYKNQKKIAQARHILTIHNLAFQGVFPVDIMESCVGLDRKFFHNGTLRFYDDMISFLKAGILYANKITTVSRTYAREILSPSFGENMNDILGLRYNDLSGIENGIDCELWNPATDEELVENYDVKRIRKKVKNKLALQERLGLRQAEDVLVIGMVSRLTMQKGFNLVAEKIHEIMDQDVQLIILGSGEQAFEDYFRSCERQYKRRMVYYGGYNEELSHHIYAGADLFLMPSLFEPCGISQLISMHYGTLPVVRETGGLKDTVTPYNQFTGEGEGFSFQNFDGNDMMNILKYAIEVYYLRKDHFSKMMRQAMNRDVSWEKSAREYSELYESVL